MCSIFGVKESEVIPSSFICLMAQILQFGITSSFDFASYLAKEIHNRLIAIAKGVMDKPFSWYSLLMYIYLNKGSSVIGRDMVLKKEVEGERMIV